MTLTSTNNSNIPFVGLHAHSVAGSPFDALGYPPEHMDYAYENGSTALALTDHGNMNGLSYQVLHAKKMQAEGKDFKPIFGVEAYFLPDLKEWRKEYEEAISNRMVARRRTQEHCLQSTFQDTREAAEAGTIYGSLEHVTNEIKMLQDAGIEYVLLNWPAGISTLRRFAKDVIPSFT